MPDDSGQRHEGALLARLFRNAAVLLTGSLGASVLGLASLALTARALGVEQFGVLVLITTYVLVIDHLLNFQSWQAVIKYGASALQQSRDDDFKSLIKFGFVLDGSTALVGAILAASLAWLLGRWQGWDEQHVLMAVSYSFTILFHVSGTPTAALRLFDRFKLISLQHAAAAAIKLAAVSVVFASDGGLALFLLAWAVADVLGRFLLIYFAMVEFSSRNILRISKSSLANLSVRFAGIWNFVWTTNIHSAVKLGLREADVFIVGAAIGSGGVGLYKIVKAIGSVLAKLTDPLYQAIYPDLARFAGERNLGALKRFMFLPMKFVVPFSVLGMFAFWLVGEYLIGAVFGADYVAAFLPALVYLIGTIIAMSTFSFHPAMLSLGKAQLSLGILIISTITYLALLHQMTNTFGLVGASAAYVIFYLVWAGLQLSSILKVLRKELS